LTIICILAFAAQLATAHGSFLVDGWRVWNNATLSGHSRVETENVPVQVTLSTEQTLWIGAKSTLHIKEHLIVLEKGCARLDAAGTYSFEAKSTNGLLAGSSAVEISRAAEISGQYGTLRELRPLSQRP
jgi:hypothetical protein